jgi:hypothetical protein
MTVKPPAAPPLPDELDRLLRRLRLPYVRRAAPDVLATANSQRWEHAEVLCVLLAEEAVGRDQATITTRRRASGLPARQDVRRLGATSLGDPETHPASAPHAGMDQTRGDAVRMRPERPMVTLPSSCWFIDQTVQCVRPTR